MLNVHKTRKMPEQACKCSCTCTCTCTWNATCTRNYSSSSSLPPRLSPPPLQVRDIGMDSLELLHLVENCPRGGETLIMRMLHILTEGGETVGCIHVYVHVHCIVLTLLVFVDLCIVSNILVHVCATVELYYVLPPVLSAPPSPELVKRVRELYHRNSSDVRFLIPVLHGLDKVYNACTCTWMWLIIFLHFIHAARSDFCSTQLHQVESQSCQGSLWQVVNLLQRCVATSFLFVCWYFHPCYISQLYFQVTRSTASVPSHRQSCSLPCTTLTARMTRLSWSLSSKVSCDITAKKPSWYIMSLRFTVCFFLSAINVCFQEKSVYTQEVLALVLQQLLEQSPLPVLFMRTVSLKVGYINGRFTIIIMWCVCCRFCNLWEFVQSYSVLWWQFWWSWSPSRSVFWILRCCITMVPLQYIEFCCFAQVWKQPKVWQGFIRCCQVILFPLVKNRTLSHSHSRTLPFSLPFSLHFPWLLFC